MRALVIVQAFLAGLTVLVGLFADGGDVWERLVIVVLHPLAAAGLLFLALSSRVTVPLALAIAALLLATVAVDLSLALAIARGALKGDWELPIIFAVIPALGVVYALVLARGITRTGPPSSPTEAPYS